MRVKICGVTSAADARLCADEGADYVGLIFAKSSPRLVSIAAARRAVKALPKTVTPVAVVKDQPLDEVREILSETGIPVAQLHGAEDPAFARALGVPVIKVFDRFSKRDLGRLRRYDVFATMLDLPKSPAAGGSIDVAFALNAKNYGRVIVSGRLDPANVGELVRNETFLHEFGHQHRALFRRPRAAELKTHPAYAAEHLSRIKADTFIGMGFSNIIALCIVIATAVTLNQQGITDIQTSAQAAEALRPIAGEFAFELFAFGIIGTGLLAVPVLAGSAAYAVSELFGWKAGLSHGFREARGFYLIIAVATGVGTLMSVFEVDPIKALVWSAIVNGIISVPIMVVMMVIGQSKSLMGHYTISARHRVFGWAATGIMAVAVAFMFATSF